MVPGQILSCLVCDGEETSGSENETRLEAAGPPQWATASVAIAPGPGSLPRHLEHQKLPQLGKDQCLPSAVHGGRGVPKGSLRPKWPRRCVHVAYP